MSAHSEIHATRRRWRCRAEDMLKGILARAEHKEHSHNSNHIFKSARMDKTAATMNEAVPESEDLAVPQPPPEYPRASFLGLPPELRLQIYEALAQSSHIHIDATYGHTLNMRKRRICHAADATFPQLCTRPDFSGLHAYGDLCLEKCFDTTWCNPFALRATCRQIYCETAGHLSKPDVGFTIEVGVTIRFLSILRAHERASLTRLTIIHANYSPCYFDGVHSEVAYFKTHASQFPCLRSLAIQSTQAHYKFCVKQPPQPPRFAPELTWQKLWFVRALHDAFEGRVTVVLDAWVVVRAGYRENTGERDEIVVVRGVLWGEKERVVKGESELSVWRDTIVEEDEKAQWKLWWKDDWLGYGRKPS